jgi:hypothetical protein
VRVGEHLARDSGSDALAAVRLDSLAAAMAV